MEATFVDALVEHKKQGHIKRNGINFHAVMCAIYDVNREHATKHSYATGDNKLRKLKERYSIFSTIPKVSGVLVNNVGRYVLADDERVLCKCYVNAYEDFYESLCILFGLDTADEPSLMYEEEEVDSVMAGLMKAPQYYASDDEEEVNSILALPTAPPPSSDPGYLSIEHTSSSASNEISKSN
ncbi:hypothetical protein Salat_0671300 [Sesamum alatum]|uniref:Myb/SANT-like domain-containing protein n=1 Tax=Sesamum alatum TaxID=300844 RepID=A0AAE2CUK9_9LAMI|nr:hypothetical protein Salat_0671300 [Sesamum alatum]